METKQESWSMPEFIRSFFIPMPLLTNGRSAVRLYSLEIVESSMAEQSLECAELRFFLA